MKNNQRKLGIKASAPLRTCFLLGLMAGTASAQLPTVPTLPNPSATIGLTPLPSTPSLEFHAPLPAQGQLPVEPLPELSCQAASDTKCPSRQHATGVRSRTLSIVGLMPRGRSSAPQALAPSALATSVPTLPVAPPALTRSPASPTREPIAAKPTTRSSQVQVAQSHVAQVQFTQIDNLPEVPEFLRGSNRTMEHQTSGGNTSGVTHAYVATDVVAETPRTLDQIDSQPPALPLPEGSSSRSGGSLSLVDGDSNDNDSNNHDSNGDARSNRGPVVTGPVMKGPVEEVPLDDQDDQDNQVGSLLDADVTGIPELSSAVRGQSTEKKSSASGTHFSMSDDGEESDASSPADWHETSTANSSIAMSKPSSEALKTGSTRSKLEVHESFSSRSSSSSTSSGLVAKSDKRTPSDTATRIKASDESISTEHNKSSEPAKSQSLDSTSSLVRSAAPKLDGESKSRDGENAVAVDTKPRALAQMAPTRPVENPIALARPIVQAVKQTSVTFPGDTIDFNKAVTQSAHVIEAGGASGTSYRDLAMQLHQAVKSKFPGSRIDIKSDEEGLIVQGLAASEAEATKILSFVRKASLCPVADQVKSRR